MRGRNVFMDSLVANGVRHLFGNPGTTENPILDSLLDYPQIEYVMHLHEGVAVGSAHYYAQSTGRTGVVNLHVAPGLGNAIGMIFGALKSGAPMVVTAGQQDTRMRLHEPVLQHDLVAMAAPVVKWAAQVERADEMALMMRRAFKIAHEPPAGPVFLALPVDVMEQETSRGCEAPGERHLAPLVADAAIDAIANCLRACERPAILAGDEIGRTGAHTALRRLAETAGAAVFQETLRLHVGLPGATLNAGPLPTERRGIRAALEGHDCIVMIGGAMFDEVWFDPQDAIPTEARLVQLDSAASRLAHKLPTDISALGDLADAMLRIADRLDAQRDDAWRTARDQRVEVLAKRRATRRDAAMKRLESVRGQSPMSTAEALHVIGGALPAGAMVLDETITAMGDVAAHVATEVPGDWFGARGGGIGQGIAGALGVAVGHPERPVVALTGDGSAMYSIQALWTAAHHALDITFVVLSNREYRVLKHNLDAYRARFDVPSNKPYPNMDLVRPILGFERLAAGMGIPAREVSDAAGLADALRDAFSNPGPHLIDVVVAGLE